MTRKEILHWAKETVDHIFHEHKKEHVFHGEIIRMDPDFNSMDVKINDSEFTLPYIKTFSKQDRIKITLTNK